MPFHQANNRLISTGQTTDRTPTGRTAKDDGGQREGATRKYEKLTAGQHSGTTTITVNSINDVHTNNVVVDKCTELMWSTDLTPLTYGSGSQGLLWDATNEAVGGADEEDIFYFTDQANAQQLAGYSDWRVPNLFELLTVLNMEAPDAQPDATYFNVGNSKFVWSSTTLPSTVSKAIYCSTTTGDTANNTKTTARAQLLLVRG